MTVGKEIKHVAKHSMIYGIGNILRQLPPFLLLPLYLNYLDASDYGIKEIIGITVDLVGLVISLNIASAMGRFYYEYENEADRNEVISTIFIAFGAMGMAGALILSTQSSLMAGSLLNSRSLSHYFLIALTSMWFNAMHNIGCDYLRVREKSKLYVTITTLRLTLALSLNVYFVAFMKLKVMGILLSNLICSVLFFFLVVIPIFYKVGFRFSWPKCKEMVKFTLPFVITELAGFVVSASDRFFVKYYGTLSLTGVYTLGYRMGASINSFVTSPFIQIWLPRRFAIHKLPHARETYARVMTYYLAIAAFIGVWMSAVSRDVLLIVGKSDYYDAAKVVPIIVLAHIIFGLHYHVQIGIMLTKKTQYLAAINIGNAVLNTALNFLLIPRYGMFGAAYATLFCYANKVAWTHWISNKLYPLKFEYGRILKIAFSAAAVLLVAWLIPYPEVFTQYMSDCAHHTGDLRIVGVKYLFLRSATMGFYVGILFVLGFWLPEEKEYMLNLAKVINGKLPERLQFNVPK